MLKRRIVEEILGEGLWPTGVTGGFSVDWEESRRHMAIAEVLTDIPDEDFDVLREQGYTFSWFIPPEWMRAEIRPIPLVATKGTGLTQMQYGKEVFLSPLLERAAWDVLVGLVAHELAHIALGHSLLPGKEYDKQEEAAWALVAQWGFEREAKKARASNKWSDSYSAYQKRRLLQKMKEQESEL